jgi:uncharacterized protein DUF4011/AAA domain-containing protein
MQMEWGGVRDDGGGRSSAGDREGQIRSAISRWRVSLIDIAAANRLLTLRPDGPGAVEVARPGADDILARLRAGGSFAFRSLKPWAGAADTVPPPAPYLLDTPREPDDLETTLQALKRRAHQASTERGWHVLHLAFGTLTWADRDRTRYASPLLLVPVALAGTGPEQPPMLEPAEADPVINPALRMELARDRIALPRLDDLAGLTLSGLLARVRAAVAAKEGWLVSERAVVSCFPPMKEEMYQDLLDHEDLAAAHPVVRALAARQPAGHAGLAGHAAGPAGHARGPAGTGSVFDAARAGRAAADVPPLVLDADSAQRACVTAALAGDSFTIDGPPGTGKSQTIANIIGALLHAGKTVLLVSEKAAALDVVADRLTGAGLGGYLLELHSDKAARRRVAASLAEALDAVPAPAPSGGTEGATRRREQLRAYARAVHQVREPLGYSLHDVLAMIASMRAVPAAPAPGPAPERLTAAALGEIRRAAAALAAAWRPAEQGTSFAWRGVTERGPLDGKLYEAASALETLAKAVRGNQILADATGLTRPSDAPALAQLLDHLLAWPEGMPDDWLTVDTLDVIEAAVAQFTAALNAITARETQAARAAGTEWSALPRRAVLPQADAAAALTALTPASADVSGLDAGQITELAQEFSATAGLLERWLATLSGLAATLGLRPPATFGNANDLLTLARLAGEPDRPERAWLSAPGHRAASAAAQALYEAHHALAQAEGAARGYFTTEALRQDVSGLVHRFANDHQGLGKFSAACRADKRLVAAFTREGVPEEAAQAQLGLAAAWKHAADALADAESRHAAMLGPHYAGRATDFVRLDRALTLAATAVRCARGQDLTRAAGYISRDAAPDGAVSGIVAEARHYLSAWQSALAPPPAIAPRPELQNGTISDAIGWLRAHTGPLRAASEFTRAVGAAAGRPLTLGQARQLVAMREAAEAAHTQLAARDAIFRELCGQLYAGAATDAGALREALEWARRLRAMITGGTGPLTPVHLDAVESAVPNDRLAKAADAWHEACSALLEAFGPQRRPELAAELDDYAGGYQLLEALFDDPEGGAVWHAYQAARAALTANGLGRAIDFCVAERIEAARVPQVIERALLWEWADYQSRTDPALALLRAGSPGELTTRCQQLDQALATAAAEDIAGACDARRRRDDTGEATAIRTAAASRTGAAGVRELLDRAGHLTQALKPCVLTTPLAVSQYLPAGLTFDVVIVDEAGRITPAAAINCLYRGGSAILAGDQKQLPPPRPADSALDDEDRWPAGADDDADPESVLDAAKASGGFGDFSLRWHYRSGHESLIAFANAAFYDGSLLPLPGVRPGSGADDPGTDQPGVELFYGGGNAGEAVLVAQRVVHHFTTRPALTLGVVTFSEAQAEAVEAAVDSARKRHPGLDRFFGTDRLRGFFVKNAAAAQGDERDVLILSVGLEPGEAGQGAPDFGALGRPGGWRGLNVAITRARYRTEIVSSIRPGDIPASAADDGVNPLRGYLDYAAGARPRPPRPGQTPGPH